MCHVKTCTTSANFPLHITDAEIEQEEAEFNQTFMTRLLTKIDWNALVKTAFDVNILITHHYSYFFLTLRSENILTVGCRSITSGNA